MVDKTRNNTRENILRPEERTEKPNMEGTIGEAIGTNLREEHGGTQRDDDRGGGTADIGKNECLEGIVEQEIPTPSSSRKDQACEPDRGGYCTVHECVGKFVPVSTKKWKDRGKGRGYGYVSGKTKKFICGKKKLCSDKPTEIPSTKY